MRTPLHDDPAAIAPPHVASRALEENDERRLVRGARGGDEHAFGALVERYGQPILSLCYASSLDAAAAEELAQDVFVAAWRGLGRFRGESAFSTWLFAIARNACVDAARTRRRQIKTTPHGDSDHAHAAVPETADGLAVLAAARELAAPLREALLMREIQGLSYEEIAALQGVPIGTVRSRLAAARSFVADRLRT